VILLFVLSFVAVAGTAPEARAQRTGEVVFAGGLWAAQVNSAPVYTGTDMIHAVQAAIDGLTANRTWKETVNIRSSGSTGVHQWDGDLKVINVRSRTILDFHGNTIHVNDTEDNIVVPIRGIRSHHLEVRNLRITGNPRYGIWLHGCTNVILENIHISVPETKSSQGPGLGIRIQERGSDWSRQVQMENILVEETKGHAVEVWRTDGLAIGSIVTRNTGGCGLLLNATRNATVDLVASYRANRGGGYAAFRTANNAGPNITVNRVVSRESGRGVFTVSGSHGVTVHDVDIAHSTSQAILIEDTRDTVINGGTIIGSGAEGVRITSRSSTEHHSTQNVTVRNLRVWGCSFGIRETLPRTNSNRIFNNDLRGNGTCLVVQGPGTVAAGNICSESGRMNDLYEAWVDRTFSESGEGSTDPAADMGGGGIPNQLRYALDQDLAATRSSLPQPEIYDGRLSIRFWRDIGKGDIAYLVEASSDLSDWSQVIYDSRDDNQANPGGSIRRVVDPVKMEEATRRALRLRIETVN
jgi:hypothetical protein